MSLENLENLLASFESLRLGPSTDSSQKSPNNLELLNNTSSENLENTDIIMAQFKPEYLNCVPQFDGNPNELNRYLSTCESLISSFYNAAEPDCFQNVYLINSLIGKLKGNAQLVVNIQNVTTWDELKNTLRRNFADQRDESCLNRDLVMLKQHPNEKPQQFYDRCLEILNLICNYVDMHEQTADARQLKRNLYNNLTLKTFLSGLREPLGTTIRCMRPTDLNQALQFVTQEDNVHYFQNYPNRNIPKPMHTNKPQMQQKHFNNLGQRNFMPPFNTHTQNNHFRAQNWFPNHNFPNQFNQMQFRPNFQPQKFPTNSQVFKRPQGPPNQNVFSPNQNVFPSNQNVFQPNRNVFQPNQFKTFPKPTPMSVSTRQTFNSNKPGPSNAGPQKNFVIEEVYNTEIDQNYQIDQQNLNETNSYCENQNTDYDEENYNTSSPYLNFDYDNSSNGANNYYCENEDVNFQNPPQQDDQT